MRRALALAVVLGSLSAPAVGMAAAPDGTYVWNTNANSQGSCIGVYSSQIKQNGQFVSGNTGVIDQTTYPGSRADAVHAAQCLP